MNDSSTPIWVDTKEVGRNHVLLPTLEYSVLVSSPAAPSLTCIALGVDLGIVVLVGSLPTHI